MSALAKNWKSKAAGVAMLGLAAFPAAADIVISYGANVAEEVSYDIEYLTENGISVVALPNLDDPNCAALIYKNEEKYRYTIDKIEDGILSYTAEVLVDGENVSLRGKSDCPSDSQDN